MNTEYTPINLFMEQLELNKKDGLPDGFYEDFFNKEKYPSLEDAKSARSFVAVYTVRNKEGFLGYHLKQYPTENEKFVQFDNQDPRFGEDGLDNQKMLEEVAVLI